MGKRFLISRLSSLGDVVCSLPAATALKAAFPDSDVTWAVDPRFAAIVERCGAVDHVLRVSPKLKPSTWPTIDGEFDAALDLQGLLKSALVLKGAKAKEKVGYHWQREGSWLFSARVVPDSSSIHIVDQYVDVSRAVGGGFEPADFRLAPLAEDVEQVQVSWPELSRYVVINPGAGWASKRWPEESVAACIKQLAGMGLQVVLIGSKSMEEQGIADNIQNLLTEEVGRSVVRLTGKTDLGQLIAVIAGAVAHIGGDTGSTHLAAALKVPAIGLYSITKPVRSCPYGQIDRCHYDPRGLSFIDPESVVSTISEVAV